MTRFKNLQVKFDFLTENFYTRNEIEFITDIFGYTEETASKLLNYETGYKNFDNYINYLEEITKIYLEEQSQIWGLKKAKEKDK